MASSGDVYFQYDLLHRRETGVPLAELGEQAPLRTRRYPYRTEQPRPATAADAWMDDYDKIPIEHALAQTRDLSWSILRLPMVYGPGDRNHRFAWAISPMSAGNGPVRIDAGWASWRTSLGFVDDVADALVLAAVHPQAHRCTFNVGPAEVKTNLEWAKAFATALAWSGELQLVPRERTPEPTRSRLEALDLTVPCILATGAIRRALGYSEVTRFAASLRATIEAERAPLT
jgi:nucleoside-diphosphate-sugar epimerase